MRDKIIWEINITPLTDVFLVLLIIFMVATPFLLHPTIKVNLPKVATAKEEPKRALVITITKDSNIYIHAKRIKDFEELKRELETELKLVEEKIVVVKGDERIPFGLAVKVMDIATVAGAERIAVATKIIK